MQHQNHKIMSNHKESKSVGRQVCLYLTVAILLLISGCANTAVLLDTNHLTGASIYEIINEGAVVGYIVISERMDFALWRDTSQKDSSGIAFILYYADNYDTD